MNDSARTTVVGIGELLWDCFGDSRRPGGAPANVAFHAVQMGLTGLVCSRVGCDEPGDALVAHLAGHGLDTRYTQRDRAHPTGTVTVDSTRPDQPRYVIHEGVAWDFLEFDAALAEAMAQASAVCFGTLAQRTARARTTIQAALDASRNAKIVYDVNLRPPHYSRETIETSLHRADIVKLNLDEVSSITRLLGRPGDDPVSFARKLLDRFGVQLVCVTRGGDGCLLVSNDETVDVPGERVTLVDAVGAGDAFTAALVYGLLDAWPLERIAHFANRVGALVASRSGAMPDLRDEFAQLIDQT